MTVLTQLLSTQTSHRAYFLSALSHAGPPWFCCGLWSRNVFGEEAGGVCYFLLLLLLLCTCLMSEQVPVDKWFPLSFMPVFCCLCVNFRLISRVGSDLPPDGFWNVHESLFWNAFHCCFFSNELLKQCNYQVSFRVCNEKHAVWCQLFWFVSSRAREVVQLLQQKCVLLIRLAVLSLSAEC